MRLLIIEDEEELLNDLAEALSLNGYAVDTANDGDMGIYMLSINSYDLLILDLNLPGVDGIKILEKLRSENQDIKVLILSARSDIDSRIQGLDIGANDYLVKPFHFTELFARVRSLLRRKFETESAILTYDQIEIDTNKLQVSVGNKKVNLSNKEYAIAVYLLKNRDKFTSQEELFEHIWDENADAFTASVRVHISTLRKKILHYTNGEMTIINQKGRGYMLVKGSGLNEDIDKT